MHSEEVTFQSQGMNLTGVLRPAGGKSDAITIICHGAFESQALWAEYAERFQEQGISIFSFDFPGHGLSQGTPSLVDLQVWAYSIRDAITYLQSEGYAHFSLVGWDMGGSAVLLVAAHDQRLASIAVMGTPIYLLPPLAERIAYGLITGAAKVLKLIRGKPLLLSRLNELEEIQMTLDEEANARYRRNKYVTQSYRSVPIPESLNSVWMDITPVLAKVKPPTLVLHSAEDQVVDFDQSKRLYDELVNTKEMKIIEGCGHAMHLDREKDIVFEHLNHWIDRYGQLG